MPFRNINSWYFYISMWSRYISVPCQSCVFSCLKSLPSWWIKNNGVQLRWGHKSLFLASCSTVEAVHRLQESRTPRDHGKETLVERLGSPNSWTTILWFHYIIILSANWLLTIMGWLPQQGCPILPQPGLCHFSKNLWLLCVGNLNQHLVVRWAHCYQGVHSSSFFQWTEVGSTHALMCPPCYLILNCRLIQVLSITIQGSFTLSSIPYLHLFTSRVRTLISNLRYLLICPIYKK